PDHGSSFRPFSASVPPAGYNLVCDLRRHQRVAVPPLEGPVLPTGPPPARLARALRDPLPRGGGQQLVLPPAQARDIPALVAVDAGLFQLRGESQPLHHAHPAPPRRQRLRRAVLVARHAAWFQARTGTVPTSPAVSSRC